MNPVVIHVLFGILGISVTLLLFLFGYILNRVNAVAKEQSDMGRHIAENYVRDHEVQEVKQQITQLRNEVSSNIVLLRNELTNRMEKLTDAVSKLISQNAKQ